MTETEALEKALKHRVEISCRPLLAVGDSMVREWPWDTDVLALPGETTMMIMTRLESELSASDHRYKDIVLWAGTAHLSGGESVASYVDDMATMTAIARQHGERVVIIGPMPFDWNQRVRFMAEFPSLEERILGDTRVLIGDVVTQLSTRLPDVPILNLGPFRDAGATPEHIDTIYSDGVHLTLQGYAELARELETVGVDVIGSASASAPSPSP